LTGAAAPQILRVSDVTASLQRGRSQASKARVAELRMELMAWRRGELKTAKGREPTPAVKASMRRRYAEGSERPADRSPTVHRRQSAIAFTNASRTSL
jgi:hypothetical protein